MPIADRAQRLAAKRRYMQDVRDGKRIPLARVHPAKVASVTRQSKTPAQVAAGLGVHPNTVRHWVRSGLMPCRWYRPGQNQPWWLTPADVKAFLADPRHWGSWEIERIVDDRYYRWAQAVRSDDLVTIEVAADIVGCSYETLWRRLRVGTLAGQRTSRKTWLVARADLPAVRQALVEEARSNRAFSPEEDAQVHRWLEVGLSYSEVARRLERHPQTVWRRYRAQRQERRTA